MFIGKEPPLEQIKRQINHIAESDREDYNAYSVASDITSVLEMIVEYLEQIQLKKTLSEQK